MNRFFLFTTIAALIYGLFMIYMDKAMIGYSLVITSGLLLLFIYLKHQKNKKQVVRRHVETTIPLPKGIEAAVKTTHTKDGLTGIEISTTDEEKMVKPLDLAELALKEKADRTKMEGIQARKELINALRIAGFSTAYIAAELEKHEDKTPPTPTRQKGRDHQMSRRTYPLSRDNPFNCRGGISIIGRR